MYNSFAVRKDGTVWSWGRNNNYGQLGLGNDANRYNRCTVQVVGGASGSRIFNRYSRSKSRQQWHTYGTKGKRNSICVGL